MKLHLPRALRGALLACFAIAVTAPSQAYDSNPEYNGKYIYLFDDANSIDTTHGTPEDGKLYVRPADNTSDPVEPGQTATIGTLNISSGLTLIVETNEWESKPSFTDLTFDTVAVTNPGAGTTRISIDTNNTLTVNSISGDINFAIAQSANLNISTEYFDADSFSGGGTVTFTSGVINITGITAYDKIGDYTIAASDVSSLLSNYTVDQLSFGLSGNFGVRGSDGLSGTLTRTDSGYKLSVGTTAATCVKTNSPTNTPYVAPNAVLGTPASCTRIEGLETYDSSSSWTLNIKGTLSAPSGLGRDIILLSSKDLGESNITGNTDTSVTNMGAGGFCLYLKENGELVLHTKEQVGTPGEEGFNGWTSRVFAGTRVLTEETTCENWVIGMYDITLSYGDIGGAMGFRILKDSTITLNDDAESTDNAYVISFASGDSTGIISEGTAPSDIFSHLYTRIPTVTEESGGTTSTITVTYDSDTITSKWNITGMATMDGLLEGAYTNASTGESTVFNKDGDAVVFHNGGSITVSSDTELQNSISSNANAAVSFMLANGATLTLGDGTGALNQMVDEAGVVSGGLTLRAAEGSTGGRLVINNVNLVNAEDSSEPASIEKLDIGKGMTLELNGRTDLAIDAANNALAASSSLVKSGSGTLRFIGKENGSTTLDTLSNEGGTLDIRNSVSATTLNAKTLKLTKDSASASATNVTVGSLEVGNPYSYSMCDNSLTADKLVATTRIDMGLGATITAGSVQTVDMMVALAATMDAGDGTITATGNTLLGGTLKSGNISITGHTGDPAYADIAALVLAPDSIKATSISNAHITVGSPAARAAAGTATLDLGTVTNSIITGSGSISASGTQFKNSSIALTGGNVTLNKTTHNSGSNISTTGAGATVSLTGVQLTAGNQITAGANTYTLGAIAPTVTLSGTATESALTLSSLNVDLSSITAPAASVLFISGGTGTVDTKGCAMTVLTAPGMISQLETLGHDLVFTVKDNTENILRKVATTENGQAMLPALTEGAQKDDEGVMAQLYNFIRNESSYGLAQRQAALDALSCGSITMLADSQRRGVTNTVNSLRNRIAQMGNVQGIEPETHVHAWIEADGSYNDIDEDGAAAGYEYETWGGTVGVHADVGNFSFGAAVSAAYGDLTAHSSDQAEGDHDTVTFSAFARHQAGHWTQMGILSIARNELDMSRTIIGDKAYTADGEANGHTITAYYEAGYAIVLNEESTHVLQPLVSVMLTSARMGNFTETGSIGNAGLCTDSEDYFYGTVGLGARYQIVLAEDANERLSFLELRAKVVQDFGDDTNEATVYFAGAPGQGFVVKGADVGSTGFQFGAGLSVPVSMYTTFFVDADADIRSGATSLNGSVGMRVEF